MQLAEKDGQLLELSAQLQATQQQLLALQRAAVSPPHRARSPGRRSGTPARRTEPSPLGRNHNQGPPAPKHGLPAKPLVDISNLQQHEGYLTGSPAKQVAAGRAASTGPTES